MDARFSALIDLGTAGYGEFLRLSAAAICPLEQALLEGKVECILPDWEERSRRAALRADLADFGIADPTLAQRPSLGEEAHQFGVLYVLEGSRLGARVLARRLLASPNLLAPRAVRYLRHGEGRPLWQTFLESAEVVGSRQTLTHRRHSGRAHRLCLVRCQRNCSPSSHRN